MNLRMLLRGVAGALILVQAVADDLAPLSDDFDNPATRSRWTLVSEVERSPADQLRVFDIHQQLPGKLLMIPHVSVWYEDYRGVLMFKPVEGDFVVSTRLRVTAPDQQGAPRSSFSLAGLMVRVPREVTPQSWRPGGENYVLLSSGAAHTPGQHALEVKTTRDSRSQLEVLEGSEWAELRVVRVGPAVLTFAKLEGPEWQVVRRYMREDFLARLQVGLTAYTDWETCRQMPPERHNQTVIRGGNPQLRAEVEYVRFSRPNVPDGLRGRNLADPAEVSDAELLRWLE